MNALLIVLTAYTWLHTISTRHNPRNEGSYDLSRFAQSPVSPDFFAKYGGPRRESRPGPFNFPPRSVRNRGGIDFALPGFQPVRTKVIRHSSPVRIGKYRESSETVVRILEKEQPIIAEIELVMSQGRESERNLTAVRDIVVAELPRIKDTKVKRQVEEKLAKIEVLLATVREKNNNFETKFRTFVDLVSKGEIHTQKEAHDYLLQLHSVFKLELSSILGRVETALTDVIRGIKSVLFNAGMLVADLAKLSFGALKVGLQSVGQIFPPFQIAGNLIG